MNALSRSNIAPANQSVDVILLAERIALRPRYGYSWEAMMASPQEIRAMASIICILWPIIETTSKLRIATEALEASDSEADQAEYAEDVLDIWNNLKAELDAINNLRTKKEPKS